MGRYIYNGGVTIKTNNLSLSIDPNLGLLSTTSSGSMSFVSNIVASYSSNKTLTYSNNIILINQPCIMTLPSNPVDGLLYTFRNISFDPGVTVSSASHNIRAPRGPISNLSLKIDSDESLILVFFNNIWYAIS